jgi:hypothetical protein
MITVIPYLESSEAPGVDTSLRMNNNFFPAFFANYKFIPTTDCGIKSYEIISF